MEYEKPIEENDIILEEGIEVKHRAVRGCPVCQSERYDRIHPQSIGELIELYVCRKCYTVRARK